MKLALYSAIYGTYEATAKPVPPDLGIPAVMFTDRPDLAEQAAAVGWTAILDESPYQRFTADPTNGDPAIVTPMLAHKYWKTHPFEAVATAELDDVDASIWVDGNMRITMPGAEWVARNVEALGDDEWSLMRHPWRDCVYTEHAFTAAACSGRYSVEAMQRLMDALFDPADPYPDDIGLFATGHMVRRHTAGVIEVCRDWWTFNILFTHQDQLSLPAVIWKHQRAPQPCGIQFNGLPIYAPKWNASLPWAMWELMPHGV